MTIVDPMRPIKRPTPAPKRPTLVVPPTRHVPKASPNQPPVKPIAHEKRRVPWRIIGLGIMSLVLLVIPEIIGQLILIVYGIIAIIRHLKPHVTFILAVIFLVLSPLMSFLAGESNGTVLASYSFFFLVIGLLQLIAEYRRMLNKKPARGG